MTLPGAALSEVWVCLPLSTVPSWMPASAEKVGGPRQQGHLERRQGHLERTWNHLDVAAPATAGVTPHGTPANAGHRAEEAPRPSLPEFLIQRLMDT